MKILDDSNFKEFVEKTTLPIVVDFWASWCNPCKMMISIIEKIEPQYTNKYIFAKCNIDESPEIAQHLNITSIPTILFFKNNKVVGTNVGLIPEAKLLQSCNQYFGV